MPLSEATTQYGKVRIWALLAANHGPHLYTQQYKVCDGELAGIWDIRKGGFSVWIPENGELELPSHKAIDVYRITNSMLLVI